MQRFSAISKYRQSAFAMRICSGVRHSGSSSTGEHTKNSQGLRRRSRDVQANQGIKEIHAARHVRVRRGGYGIDHDGGSLSLELEF
jgi:hypothetical protein